MAMVMLGMFALTPVGITGSIVQQINHGISTGALFLIVGIVYERRHTRQISEYGGLSKVMPVFAAIFLDHDDVVDRAAGAERVHRRDPDPAGRLRRQQDVGGRGGGGHRARRRLHAVALSADDVRQDRQPGERVASGPEPREVAMFVPLVALAILDRHLPGAVPAPARNVGRPRRGARELRLRAGDCQGRARLPHRRRRSPSRTAPPGIVAEPAVHHGPANLPRRRSRTEAAADASRLFRRGLLLSAAGDRADGRLAAWCSCLDVMLPRRSGPIAVVVHRRGRWPPPRVGAAGGRRRDT